MSKEDKQNIDEKTNGVDEEEYYPWDNPNLSPSEKWANWLHYYLENEEENKMYFKLDRNLKRASCLQVFCDQLFSWLRETIYEGDSLLDGPKHYPKWEKEIKEFVSTQKWTWEKIILAYISDEWSDPEDIKILISWSDYKGGNCQPDSLCVFCKKFINIIKQRIKKELQEALRLTGKSNPGARLSDRAFFNQMKCGSINYHCENAIAFSKILNLWYENLQNQINDNF